MDMKKGISLGGALLLTAALLLRAGEAAQAARQATELCVQSVIPALFPFFAVTGLAVKLDAAAALEKAAQPLMRRLFRLRGVCAVPLAAGLVGGYPTGARSAAELYRDGAVSREEAELLLGFCNNCGPAFILGFVGTEVLQSGGAGAALYAIHVLSALLTGMILCRSGKARGTTALPCPAPKKPPSLPEAFTASVAGAMRSTAGICAYVVLFRTAIAVTPIPEFFLGALEMVSAVTALTPGRSGFVAAAGILGWGGLCVHCQTMSVAEGLSLKYHWMGKAMQAGLSTALALLVLR